MVVKRQPGASLRGLRHEIERRLDADDPQLGPVEVLNCSTSSSRIGIGTWTRPMCFEIKGMTVRSESQKSIRTFASIKSSERRAFAMRLQSTQEATCSRMVRRSTSKISAARPTEIICLSTAVRTREHKRSSTKSSELRRLGSSAARGSTIED